MTRSRKFRGYRRHGHGMKGRRGRGLRGGEGMSGLGKHRWMWLNKYYFEHWGRHGFVHHSQTVAKTTINILDLEENLPVFADLGFAKKEEGMWNIDLTGAGVTKLLGLGKVTQKMKVKVAYASKQAVDKIKNAGGEVELNA